MKTITTRKMIRTLTNLTIGCAFIGILIIHSFDQPAPIPLERPDRGGVTALLRAAIDNGVPLNLAVAIAFTESKFRCRATSHAGAVGIAQVMPRTAVGMGVDPASLTSCAHGANAGMKYLRKMLDACNGDNLCAARKFNGGPNRVGFPAETKDYVRKIAALLG